MAQNLAPAIRYARDGHPVHETIAYYWNLSVPRLAKWPGFTEQFTIDGRAPRTGEVWKNPNLAKTLETIANGGRDAFYTGTIARTIDAYFRANDGFLRYEDLAAHRGEWVEPVSTSYRGYDVWELPPNGQGISVLQMLNLLERHEIAKMGPSSADYLHLFLEAKKLAYADRAAFYADMDFADVPVQQLISKAYATKQAERIDMQKAAVDVPPGDPKLAHGDTVYITVVDKDRNCCSLIQSNYYGFGSHVVPGKLGETLVVAARYDTSAESPGVNASASGAAVLLTLARQLAGRRLERSLRMVWLCNENESATASGACTPAAIASSNQVSKRAKGEADEVTTQPPGSSTRARARWGTSLAVPIGSTGAPASVVRSRVERERIRSL